jgi:hypothetical protein
MSSRLVLIAVCLQGCGGGVASRRAGAAAPAPADASPTDRPSIPVRADAGGEAPAPADAPAPAAACGVCRPDQICAAGRCQSKGDPFVPTFGRCAVPPCINVYNNCAVPLWTHAVATVPLDEGNVRKLEPGEQWQYGALPPFGGGRLYAYYKEPEVKQDRVRLVSDYNQFVEMTVDRDGSGAWAQNYNVSYVDYLSLPVSMKATGDGCAETRCGTRFEEWTALLRGCPTDLRDRYGDLGTCTGSYDYCITPDGAASYDTTRRYCSKMQDAHGLPGSAVYGGTFPGHPPTEVPFWDGVAAWNRGTFPGDADDGNYYRNEPYNHYAGWIHRDLGCPNVYAFSTDDHQDKAGFVRCASPELNVVWCPYH